MAEYKKFREICIIIDNPLYKLNLLKCGCVIIIKIFVIQVIFYVFNKYELL